MPLYKGVLRVCNNLITNSKFRIRILRYREQANGYKIVSLYISACNRPSQAKFNIWHFGLFSSKIGMLFLCFISSFVGTSIYVYMH